MKDKATKCVYHDMAACRIQEDQKLQEVMTSGAKATQTTANDDKNAGVTSVANDILTGCVATERSSMKPKLQSETDDTMEPAHRLFSLQAKNRNNLKKHSKVTFTSSPQEWLTSILQKAVEALHIFKVGGSNFMRQLLGACKAVQ